MSQFINVNFATCIAHNDLCMFLTQSLFLSLSLFPFSFYFLFFLFFLYLIYTEYTEEDFVKSKHLFLF